MLFIINSMVKVKNGILYQWDLNRIIEIDDPDKKVTEIHCCYEDDKEALTIPFTRNGVSIEAVIPNILLQSEKKINVYVGYKKGEEEITAYHGTLCVVPRQQPSDYLYEETEILHYKNLKEELIEAISHKADLDKGGKLRIEQLPEEALTDESLSEAVSSALALAKSSGEFDGDTPVKGTDYFTSADKEEIREIVIARTVTQNTGNSTDKVMSQDAVTKALGALAALPYGGSKEWLENNGDKSRLYQIGGYVWGYVEADGWTKSDTQFIIVTNKSQMLDTSVTSYLLRSGDSGTVYTYSEASGDAGIPVYSTLPSTGNDGDIVAVGDRKYKAKILTNQLPNWTTNYANPSSSEWLKDYRCNSSGTTAFAGLTVTNFIEVPANSSFYIAGIDLETTVNGQTPKQQMYTNRNSTPSNNNNLVDFAAYKGKSDGVYTFKNENSDTRYYRFCGVPISGDNKVVITIDEEITYTTETIISWSDIGAYTPPVSAGWSATDETYNVIDSLSASANSGTSAVYSVDGYLYSYIGGSDWMQTSKYNAPTLSIDGELSDSSVNAVQNKAVTATINEVKAKANTNANEITAINQRMAEIETGSNSVVIPSFWQSAVDEVITKIKALQVGKNCVTFPFFSDNHQRNGYAGILISHIMKECGIPYCFFGGDTISSGYLVESEMIEQDKAFDSIMSYIPEGRFCRTVGNHDGFWNDNGDKGYYTREKIYELFLRCEGIAQNKHFGDDGTYYFIDDIASKVRFIVLNTNSVVISAGNESIDDAQLTWLQNKALSFDESGWGVVIISHCPISNHYHANVSNAEAVINAVKATDADIIGWYSGHIHRDRMYTHLTENGAGSVEGDNYLPLGFTEVTITSDHTGIAYDDATKHTVANDALSHAIDFVTVNRDTRTVNITRLGIGEDRSYSY